MINLVAFNPLREQARKLRLDGESIKDIARDLNAAPSTISYWCRDIVLSPSQITSLVLKQERAGTRGRLLAAEKKRRLRIISTENEYLRGKKDVGKFSKRDEYVLGLALYWGEGLKSGNEECGITNSDPAIIRAFQAWLWENFKIPTSDLIARVSFNSAHAHRATSVEKEWSEKTKIPLSQFSRISLVNSTQKKKYKNPTGYIGTLRVKVRRATNLRRRILGAIQALQMRYKKITPQT